jgi:two-component SAPR family response regulator
MKSALIIDDEEGIANAICIALPGFARKNALTMKDALDALQQFEFDVVFLDLGLPDSTVENTTRMIPLVRRIARDAAIVVVTGFPRAISAEDINADAVLVKPFTSSSLESVLHDANVVQCRRHMASKDTDFYRTCDMIRAMARV